MRDHANLRAFQVADQAVLLVYRKTMVFPEEERFGIRLQMRRSALSTASNIVEGCARNSEADSLRFLDIAYGSARELEYQVTVAIRLGYLNERDGGELAEATVETSKVLYGLIRSCRK